MGVTRAGPTASHECGLPELVMSAELMSETLALLLAAITVLFAYHYRARKRSLSKRPGLRTPRLDSPNYLLLSSFSALHSCRAFRRRVGATVLPCSRLRSSQQESAKAPGLRVPTQVDAGRDDNCIRLMRLGRELQSDVPRPVRRLMGTLVLSSEPEDRRRGEAGRRVATAGTIFPSEPTGPISDRRR